MLPKAAGGDIRTFAEGFQLQPDGRFNDPFPAGKRPETAVGTGNHPFPITDGCNSFLNAARDNFRMLDDVAGGLDTARDEDHMAR